MKINTNYAAQLANVSLRKTEKKYASSLERLSSGYKINKAADDASGLAISNKMRTQIRALDQASRNASDGNSVLETAEGAMSEIENMLQRVRELSVQAANDTYCLDDRESIQSEVEQMLDEIDRVASTTEYNGSVLLDGSFSHEVNTSSDDVYAISSSDTVGAGTYGVTIVNNATSASGTLTYAIPTTAGETTSVSINGNSIEITSDDTDTTVYNKISKACDKMGITVSGTGTSLTLSTNANGSSQEIRIKGEGDTEANVYYGTDAEITLGTGFASTATYSADGDNVTISDVNGFEIRIEITSEATGSFNINTFDAGQMVMQIGANEGQNLGMDLPELDCLALSIRSSDGTDKINCCSSVGAENAITVIDKAISIVSAARSKLGAYENRLDSTIDTLDTSSENITDSMSRISDTDISSEMTKYTQYDIMTQTQNSMLAQANNRVQQALTLLQS